MPDSPATDSPEASVGEAPALRSHRRRPIPRKGHKKSRAGCLVCKRRKVKCDEAMPHCDTCVRLNLACEYQQVKTGRSLVPTIAQPMRTAPAMFDINDMRFFRHFMFEAYPALPVDGFSTWQEVTRLSHEYDFLLHAMLGLGASHLNLISPGNFEKAALKHRVLAIQSLNKHFAQPIFTGHAAEAAFGAVMSLTFQSAYMRDGMVDFFTMIRGCILIGRDSIGFRSSVFKSFERGNYTARLHDLLGHDRASSDVDEDTVWKYCASTKRLQSICTRPHQIQLLEHFRTITGLALTDPPACYRKLTFLWDRVGRLTTEEFDILVDPKNHASRLILLHGLALDAVMSKRVKIDDCPGDTTASRRAVAHLRQSRVTKWCENIMESLPSEYREYGEWSFSQVKGLQFSFEQENKVWQPFFLTCGKAVTYENNNADTPYTSGDDLSLRQTPERISPEK